LSNLSDVEDKGGLEIGEIQNTPDKGAAQETKVYA
jgi:hypothetical protein